MKDEKSRDLIARTKKFALEVIRLYSSLPKSVEAQILGKQILRSGTSVGAQYREAQRAKSTADLISKVERALQELDETAYWLELLVDAKLIYANAVTELRKETDELIAIFVSIAKSAKAKKR